MRIVVTYRSNTAVKIEGELISDSILAYAVLLPGKSVPEVFEKRLYTGEVLLPKSERVALFRKALLDLVPLLKEGEAKNELCWAAGIIDPSIIYPDIPSPAIEYQAGNVYNSETERRVLLGLAELLKAADI